jgi:hypothetical protein
MSPLLYQIINDRCNPGKSLAFLFIIITDLPEKTIGRKYAFTEKIRIFPAKA